MQNLKWDNSKSVVLDHTVMFGNCYSLDGLTLYAQSAKGLNGNYLMWPDDNIKKWSLYRDSDGAIAFEKFDSKDACKQAAEEWNKEIL